MRWTEEEIESLKINYSKLPNTEIARRLNRTEKAVINKLSNLGLAIRPCKKWNDKESNILKKYYESSPKEELLKLLPNRSWSAIILQAQRLKLKRNFKYSYKERGKKISDTKKRLFKEGKIKSWQTGLTIETDERIKKLTEKSKKTRRKLIREGKLHSPLFGKHLSENSRKQQSISKIGFDLEKYKNQIIKEYEGGYGSLILAKKFKVGKGTILNYLKKWGVNIRENKYRHKLRIKCDDGHIVLSSVEKFIDNFLFHNGISHIYSKKIGYGNYKCDFYILDANVWIEYFGLIRVKKYKETTKRKLKIYKELGLKLIPIFPFDDIQEKLRFLIPQYAKIQKTITDFIISQ